MCRRRMKLRRILRLRKLRNNEKRLTCWSAGQPFGLFMIEAHSRYERGTRTIPVEHLLILADFYGVSTDYILGRTNVKEINKG